MFTHVHVDRVLLKLLHLFVNQCTYETMILKISLKKKRKKNLVTECSLLVHILLWPTLSKKIILQNLVFLSFSFVKLQSNRSKTVQDY